MKSCLPELTSKIPLISVVVPFTKKQKYKESEKKKSPEVTADFCKHRTFDCHINPV